MRYPFVRFCLGIIVVLLALIACRQGPTIVHGAAPREYKVVFYSALGDYGAGGAAGAQKMLNEQAKDGWELVTALGENVQASYIFRK